MAAAVVSLLPVREEDLAILERLTGDPAATGEFAWFGWYFSIDYRREWADNRMLGESGGTLIVHADEAPAGFVNWRRVPATVGTFFWEIGAAILPEHRGRGLGTAAQRQLAEYLFAHTIAQRVQAITEVDNVAERRSLEKAGFTREGVSRALGWRDGAWRDGVTYAVVRGDLPQQ